MQSFFWFIAAILLVGLILTAWSISLKRQVAVKTRDLAREIGERHRAEARILLEKEFTDVALNAQLDTFFLFEPATGRALRWNQAFRDISGYKDEEIAALQAPDAYYGPEDLARAAIFTQQLMREGAGTIELALISKDGAKIPTEYVASLVRDDKGEPRYIIAVGRDISSRKMAETEREELIAELQKVIREIKTLQGIIPICSYCKKIRTQEGVWDQLEKYIHDHSDAQFSHGACPECYAQQMREMDDE